MTYAGGESFSGNIFKTDENGNNQTVEYEFLKIEEAYPYNNRLCEASNGMLYGMTNEGGENNVGAIFEFDPLTKIYTKKIDFDYTNGASPYGGLIEASNGKLYGTTQLGGTTGKGVLFEYNYTTNVLTKLLDFDGANKGANSTTPLLQASNGKLYGTTTSGGSTTNSSYSGDGVLFEYDLDTNTFTKLFDFISGTSGSGSSAGLIQASNGKLYGTTQQGGNGHSGNLGDGVLYEYDIVNDAFTTKLFFDYINKGWAPVGDLLEADNGKLYGTTRLGGTTDIGVLFKYDIDTDTYTKILDFNNTDKGGSPRGSLIQLSNGKIYGTTSDGGIEVNSNGIIFEFDPITEGFINKKEIGGLLGNGSQTGLVQATNGKLYGLTGFGGTGSKGVLFEYDHITNSYIKEIDFKGWQNGSIPYGNLLFAANDKFYGLTRTGGGFNKGTLFEFDPSTNLLIKKIDFDGDTNGENPEGNLIQAANGKLYGLSTKGSPSYNMVLFEFDPVTNAFVNKLTEVEAELGGEVHGSLLEAANGKLYGLTNAGGNLGKGILFEYDLSTSTFTKKFDFDGSNNGAYPYGDLIQSSNGKLYGLTRLGGTDDEGTLFEYNIATNTFTKKIDFQGTINGSTPLGSLLEAANGELYGMTSKGGTDDLGTLFEYNIVTNTIIKKIDFDGTNKGQDPRGNLVQGSNGNLYGLTQKGGVDNRGVMFQFDISTDTFIKKIDFDGDNGYWPYGSLVEINSNSLNTQNYNNNLSNISIYPNPITTELTISYNLLIINEINLYDMTGKFTQKIILKEDSSVDLTHLNSGIYMIRINTDKGNFYHRIIKM